MVSRELSLPAGNSMPVGRRPTPIHRCFEPRPRSLSPGSSAPLRRPNKPKAPLQRTLWRPARRVPTTACYSSIPRPARSCCKTPKKSSADRDRSTSVPASPKATPTGAPRTPAPTLCVGARKTDSRSPPPGTTPTRRTTRRAVSAPAASATFAAPPSTTDSYRRSSTPSQG